MNASPAPWPFLAGQPTSTVTLIPGITVKNQSRRQVYRILVGSMMAMALFEGQSMIARVLDDFNDNTLTAWQKFDFGSGIGQMTEANGKLTIGMAMAPGRQFFVAATKTTKTFTLQDRRTIEFRVDLVNANQPNAFAVLAWVPTSGSVSTLQGYSLAKDVDDVLIAKGLEQYFVDATGAVKNENVTLVLRLTGAGNSVVINAKILDKDATNAVLFERTFTDTAGADPVGPAAENPVASYINQPGQFVVMLFHNDENGSLPPSEVTLDNAEYTVTDDLVLDDFNGNQLTDWQKFDFSSGIGQLSLVNQQMSIGMALPPGRQFFVAATKTSRTFAVNDGDFAEFRVDLMSANQPDAFGILAWVPVGGSVATLQGYSMAKDVDDVIIAKGLSQYFVDSTGALKNENVTLVLRMTGAGSSVVISGKVLDKDATNAVLFDRTFTDTAGQDPVGPAAENPVGSYIGQSGQFVLMLFHNDEHGNLPPSQVAFDNAEATFVPAEGNTPPAITDIQPANGASFLPASTKINFKVADDKSIPDNNIQVTLNGVLFTSANGLVIGGAGTNRTAQLGGLATNVNYVAKLQVTDTDGAATSALLYFDTFATNNFLIECEDYNFGGGQFIDNPVLTPEGASQADSYHYQVGAPGIDFLDFGNSPNGNDNIYRPEDTVHTVKVVPFDQRPNYIAAGGSAAGFYDYVVTDIATDEFLNYTRTFPPGSYEVYLRESVFNLSQAETILEKVLSSTSESNQTTRVIGSFLASKSGVEYRNVPLTDGTGLRKVIARLSGVETLRLQQNNQPDVIQQNYLIFLPVADPGLQRASVTSVSPAPNSVTNAVEVELRVVIENNDTSVKISSLVMHLNQALINPTIITNINGVTLHYNITPLPVSGATNVAQVLFCDNFNVFQTNEWSFVINYNSLYATNRVAGTAQDRGFSVRLVQAPAGSNLENSLARAEEQLANPSSIPAELTTNTTAMVINYTQNELPSTNGYFPDTATFPGIDPFGNTDDMSMEVLGYLQLSAGTYRFGVVSDDGFKCASGAGFSDPQAVVLGYRNGTFDGMFDFVVEATGLYPFRFIWYERGGGAHVEWFSVDRTTGERTLIDDPDSANSIKAYRTMIPPPSVTLVSSPTVNGVYKVDTSAVVNYVDRTVTIRPSGATQFYRLGSDKPLKITSIRMVGGNVVLQY
jgi:hypothetical protein